MSLGDLRSSTGTETYTVGEPRFGSNGLARPEGYHILTEDRDEAAPALCLVSESC